MDKANNFKNRLRWNKNDDKNWEVIEVSKVTNKIIKQLVKNLELELSDNFFISFESILKIGKRVKPFLEAIIKNLSEENWRFPLFEFILNYINHKEFENPLIIQLYHSDFIVRARAIMQAELSGKSSIAKYILPLMDDPDDSVRWAAINYFINSNQLKNLKVKKKIESRRDVELNSIIQEKLIKIIKK